MCRPLLCCMLLVSMHTAVVAQSLSVAERLSAAIAWQPDTRVLLNKHFFMTGEPVHFSVQAFAGNKPAAVEKLAFLELFDRNNKALLQTTITLVDGKGQGTWTIPDTIASDNYLLRVYTHAQKNLGVGAFRQTMLTIVNTVMPPDWNGMAQPDSLHVNFFPEGGRLVAGLLNRTAVVCSNQFGEAVNGKGYLLNDRNDTIANFTTCCNGRADFAWTPESGQQYRLVLALEGRRPQVVTVPEPDRNGYTLQVTPLSGDEVQVNVHSASKTDNSTMLLVWGGVNAINLVNGTAAMRTSVKALPAGRSAIMLFDGQGNQRCQRWWYTQQEDRLAFDVSVEKQLAPSQQAAINIRGNSISNPTDFTVSVYRFDSLQAWSSDAALQLASDQQLAALPPGAVDLMLLTIGTPWQGPAKEQPAGTGLFFPFFKSPEVSFRLGTPAQGQYMAGVQVRLSVPGKSFRFFNAVSDSSGIARFPLLPTAQNDYLLVTTGANNREVQLLPLFAAEPPVQKVPRFRLPEAWADQLREHLVASQVGRVFTQSDSAAVRNDTIAFFGKGDKTYFLDEYTRFPTLEEVFREYVPEVNVRQRSGNFLLRVFNDPYKQYFEQDPLILLDGIPVSDMNALMQISPLLIRKLQIVARRFVHGQEAYEGIVSLTTYTGNYRMPKVQPALFRNPFGAGISQLGQEASNTAAQASMKVPHIPDQRLQVYWLPHVQATKALSGLRFVTPDLPGTYIIVVNGWDAEGRHGRATAFFEVRP